VLSDGRIQLWNDCDQSVLPPVTEIPPNALIVVVDDDVFERMGASGMFVDADNRVLEAGDADEALRFFETNADIRLLFTDVSMPGSMSGRIWPIGLPSDGPASASSWRRAGRDRTCCR